MKKEDSKLIGYKSLTQDGMVMKKILKQGFGPCPVNGLELSVHYTSELEDGRFLDNTQILKEPYVFSLGKLHMIPGMEIALRSMKMGETAQVWISPEYSFLAQEKLKEAGNLECLSDEELRISNTENPYSEEELQKMEPKDAKKYLPVIYEVELLKFDKHRTNKLAMSPDERIGEAAILKNEGNELFREKRYNEAILKYQDGLHYLSQMPTEFLSEKVIDLRHQLNLNISNSHIGLSEYNYALKTLEEAYCIKSSAKCFYFRAVCYMNLGEFPNALEDLNKLDQLLPNDMQVKKLFAEYERLKEKTIHSKKELSKRGLLLSNLYAEKEIITSKAVLPKLDLHNKCFFLDLIINQNTKNPQKVKFEIFTQSNPHMKLAEDYINSLIKNKLLSGAQIQIIPSDFEAYLNCLVLKEILPEEVDLSGLFTEQAISLSLSYPPAEELLLVLIRKVSTENCFNYYLAISMIKISELHVQDILVLGRCYYNRDFLFKLKEESMELKITDIDYTLNI